MINMSVPSNKPFLAVDVVLIPPDEVMEEAIAVNRRLSKHYDDRIALDKEHCLPHITLAMGCIRSGDIGAIDSVLSSLARKIPPLNLQTEPGLEDKAWMRIKEVKSIIKTHEDVMRSMYPFFNYIPTKDMFFKKRDEEVGDIAVEYVRNFPVDSAFDNFIPHITVGSGDRGVEVPGLKFSADELALCHLGSFCTCRKIVLSHRLRGRG